MSHFLTSHSLDTPGASQGLNGGESVAAPLPGPGVHLSQLSPFDSAGFRIQRGHTVYLGSVVGLVLYVYAVAGAAEVRWASGVVSRHYCHRLTVVRALGRLNLS